METAYEQLANRLKRVHKHLRKWAKRTGVTCYRLYEKDIPDQPLIVDWYDGAAVCWAFERTRNETPADEEAWLVKVTEAIREGLSLPSEQVFLKRRFRQQDRQEGDGQYHKLASVDSRSVAKTISEHGLLLEVNLSDYVDTGLFLDHRPTRKRVGEEALGKRVLNLFAYTGAFTVHARAGRAASTTTVDLSNTYLDWAMRNLALNGFVDEPQHRIEKADCMKWLEGAPGRREQYDLIICDPPTFSNSKAMKAPFRVDLDHPWMIGQCAKLLSPSGVLYFSTNFRGFRLTTDKLPPLRIEDISEASVPEDFRNRKIHQCWRMSAG